VCSSAPPTYSATTLALALTDDSLRQELLLDEHTYAYRGQRSTALQDVKDVKRGHIAVAARVAAGIVDEPGRRP
jgi:hypothetical protein